MCAPTTTVIWLVAGTWCGCSPAVVPARLVESAPPSQRELESEHRMTHAHCGALTGLVFPGAGQLCQGRIAEGAVLSGLAAAELGTAAAVAVHRDEGWKGFEHPAAAVPLVAVQDLWMAGYADARFEVQRARRLRFVPQENLGELAVAPFNPHVLSRTNVWLALPLMVAAGVGVSVLAGEPLDTSHAGQDPNLFGRTVDRAWGYPAAGAVGMATFAHVAVGEETAFRGLLQSTMARETNETAGWAGASLAFGALHATNVAAMPTAERERYLALGVPFITVLGSYMGLSYRWNDYSLSVPVALHFWYDFLLSAVYFAADPTTSPLSASVRLSF